MPPRSCDVAVEQYEMPLLSAKVVFGWSISSLIRQNYPKHASYSTKMLNFAENSSLNGKKILIIYNSRDYNGICGQDDYLNALRRLTRKGDPSVLIRAMERARLFSSKIIGDNFEESRTFLDHSNAFKDGDGYILVF